MKIRITKAPDGAWYENYVGEVFDVIQFRPYGVIVEEAPDGTQYWVDHEDYEEVEEPNHDAG